MNINIEPFNLSIGLVSICFKKKYLDIMFNDQVVKRSSKLLLIKLMIGLKFFFNIDFNLFILSLFKSDRFIKKAYCFRNELKCNLFKKFFQKYFNVHKNIFFNFFRKLFVKKHIFYRQFLTTFESKKICKKFLVKYSINNIDLEEYLFDFAINKKIKTLFSRINFKDNKFLKENNPKKKFQKYFKNCNHCLLEKKSKIEIKKRLIFYKIHNQLYITPNFVLISKLSFTNLINLFKYCKQTDYSLGIKNQICLQFQESDNSWSKIEVIENFFHQKKIIDKYSVNEKNNINGSKIGESYLRVNNRLYLKLKLIGKGGTSKVYKVLSEDKGVYALKKSRLQNLMIENFHNCINEISILKSLKGKSGIIDLQDADISIKNAQMLIILELGDCDLDYIIRKNSKVFGKNSFVKFIWKSMIESVQTIHGERIVHGDLKPANFLIVNNSLKIIDFGIARGIQKDTTNITRNMQIGTINYMSPEAISDTLENFGKKKRFKLSRSADIWSLGCILFQIIYGQTPFFHLTIGKKIQAITSKQSYLSFLPVDIPHVIDVLKNCLKKDPESRPSIPELLNHPFLNTKGTQFTFVKGENMKKYSIK